MKVDLSGKTALITGASRGIGAAVAKAYAAAGAHVILIARTVGGLEEVDDAVRAAGGRATLMPLDISKLDDLDKLGPTIAANFGKLDIFVGNAGVLGTLGPLGHTDAKVWNRVMDVNLHANFRLIRTLEPLLRASPAGRVICTSSGLAQLPLAYWAAYCASKAAVEMMVKVYAAETEKTNIRANLVDPGLVETAMLREAFPGGYPGVTRKPEDTVGAYLELAAPGCRKNGEVVKA
ncbi:MAG TPA: SDR family NAD(P)-dependent oxidoreductase [Alphaproteobacteria bacterium]